MGHDLKTVALLSELKFREASGKLLALASEESRIRKRISDLKSQVQAENELTLDTAATSVLWKMWANKNLLSLNEELARVLALKEMHLTKVRKCHGRMNVGRSLVANEKAARKKSREKASFECILPHL